jgi:hypothetical protein
MIQDKVIQQYLAELQVREHKSNDSYQRQDSVSVDESESVQGPHQSSPHEAVEPPLENDNGFGQGIFP